MMKLYLPIALSLLLSSPFALGQMMDYHLARETALKHEQESSAEYVKQLTDIYTAMATEHMPRCAEEAEQADDSLISIVGRLGPEGQVLHHWTLGNSTLLPCFLESYLQATFPAPETQPYFTVLDMRGDPKKYNSTPAGQEKPASQP
jgi:hypothetical protein